MTQGRRVLVCDDEPQILRALRVILRDAGFEVVTAQTAQEALDLAALRAPNAAILDLILPDGNGIDVCRSIREWSEMPILVLSAVGEGLDSPAPLRESEAALPMLELIEQLATRAGVPVDSRIERGRTPRHALTALLDNEGYDTLVVPAKTSATDGFDPTDIAWLLENAPGEVLVLRPEPATAPGPSGAAT